MPVKRRPLHSNEVIVRPARGAHTDAPHGAGRRRLRRFAELMSATTRIVTVDDHAPFREAARALIEIVPGFELVEECRDGETALRVVEELDADLVIIDVRMEGLDGIETARRMRTQDASRVVVLATSGTLSEFEGLAASCGAAALVRKHWFTPRLLRGLWIAHRRR
jgi:CheY-like chemotaxis protein